MRRRQVLRIGLAAVVAVATVVVFTFFDRTSHSASDTLRPFVITMFPLWLLAAWGFWRLRRLP